MENDIGPDQGARKCKGVTLEATAKRAESMKSTKIQAIEVLMVIAAVGISQSVRAHDVAPEVVTTGGVLKLSLDDCMKKAKSAADRKGFTENQQAIIDKESNSGDFYASKDIFYSLHVNCHAGEKIWTIGVSGRERDEAWLNLVYFFLAFP